MKILGVIIILMAFAVMVCMQIISVEMVKRDVRKEERINAYKYGIKLADRRYRELIRNTEFIVHQKVSISNESDIKW